MKLCIFILFSLLSIVGYGQSIYTSFYTQTWPTIFNSRIAEVEHSISFEENAILLATETNSGKEIETFSIKRIEEADGATEYYCLTRDNKKITIVKPLRKPRFIDIYRISEKTGEKIQYRLLLN